MASLIGRLRARPDSGPDYTVDDSDEEEFLLGMDQTTGQPEGIVGGEEVSPLSQMEHILDCKMRPTASSNQPDSDNVAPEQVVVKQYLVKWKGLSYLHCSWVPEKVFEKAYKSIRLLRKRVTKFHEKMEIIRNNGGEHVAIRPEWTTVNRIIDCRGVDGDKEYLVKYKELPYDECYWESESDISTFQNQIRRFKEINSGLRREKYRRNERSREDFQYFAHDPGFLTGSLHPYQLEGLNFLRYSWSKRTHVILADEMGLGKTIQSIAFLASLLEENLAPFLVVAPLSTLANWEREFATWAPHMNVVMYGGNSQARSVIREHEFYLPKDHLSISGGSKRDRIKFDVLLTSYEMINADTDHLKPIKWTCMIVDEGHRLKNKDSKLFSSLKQFKSKQRILLTGTPLQNKMDELFVLMNFLDPEKFESLENFQKEFHEINKEEQISRLHRMLAPHLLRRRKKEVLKDLPPKKELILRVDLSSQQRELYKDILTRNYENLAKKFAPRRSNVLMELRKVCLHPYMVALPDIQVDVNEAYKKLMESSGKLQLLDKMMVKLNEQGHRVLIYTQFQHMLDLLEDYCCYKKWIYERIDGKVGGAERQRRIDRFNAVYSHRFCFLLSTRAGGLGINLATADTVIIYDSDWNPHSDLQAMARAHRLGQKNKVMVYRLINRDTVEEAMMQMAKKKMLLEHLVVGNLKAKDLTQDELDDIIKFGSKELFSEENGEAAKSGKINYDDAAIEKLLDRDHVDAEEVTVDDEEENDFFKAFKVANIECIEENNEAAEKKAQETANYCVEVGPERVKYWEELLKDKHQQHQAKELIALGKRKRSCKQILKEDDIDLSDLKVSSDDDDYDDETAGQGSQMRRKPYKRRVRGSNLLIGNSEPIPLTEAGKREPLIVRGLNKGQRKTFLQTFMRYGVSNYDWKKYVQHFKTTTYDQIKEYGTLFLKHISEDTTDDNISPAFSDGLYKEGLKKDDVLLRVALLMEVEAKVKRAEEEPTKPIFPDRIKQRFPGLTSGTYWKEEHEKLLLRGVYKHGFGKWQAIVEDQEIGILEHICKEMNITNITSTTTQTRDTMRRLSDFLRKRFRLLEDAINYESAEDYSHGQNGSAMRAEQAITGKQVMNAVGASVVEAAKEQLPKTDRIISPNLASSEEICAAAVDKRLERIEVAQPYNQVGESSKEKAAAQDVHMEDAEIEVIVLDD
ncbi:unnamed protein product [Microthlaspi erraticum]|uniref:DNA helicase n=1 Tax=Microthlaspi erraticum TaxID=1685480 RepID=A0A6D2JNX4_9BRAS|nr:unnamed protein product [Microthlaspi erraticum]